MHSWPIMVESMSARKSFLRRTADWLHHDVDRQVAARLAQAAVDGAMVVVESARRRECRPPPRRTASAPVPAWGSTARAPSTMVRVERGVGGIADQRGDEGHLRCFVSSSREAVGKAVLIAGPTASGKSALALELAQETGGVVINADSMQVYRDLRVITARPTPDEEARVPHRLYGHVDAAVNYSAGALGGRRGEALRRGARARPPADLRRRHRALFQGADARAVGGAADPRRDPRRRARAAGARRRRGAACGTARARSACRAND